MDSEVVVESGQIVCTRNPTGHSVLVDFRFEMPSGESEIEKRVGAKAGRRRAHYPNLPHTPVTVL